MIKGSEAIKIVGEKLVKGFSIDKEPLFSVYKKTFEKFIRRLETYNSEKGVLLIGSIGSGKTILMKVMQKLFIDSNSQFLWVSSSDLKDMLDDGYNVTEIKTMYGRDLKMDLYIDDIGFTNSDYNKYGNCVNIISEILFERNELFVNENFKTHISSNTPTHLDPNPKNIATIESMYGKRVYDRIRQMCELTILQGESLR